MDSITQIALGGAVGYAVLGNRVGRKAVLWGAAIGTLPDLDVLIPYGDAVANFTYHRSFSHSLLVHILASPFIAWLIMKIHKGTEQYRQRWFWLVFLCLSTHAILDSFTVYGTQLLWPFSEYPFGVANLFIIDPLVTLPLLFGFIAALLPQIQPLIKTKMNHIGLVISGVYIGWTLVAKVYIDHKVEAVLASKNIPVSAYVSAPAPFNTFLWRVVAMSEGKYYEGYASVFDAPSEVSLDAYPTYPGLIAPLNDAWGIARLKWFTKGLYSVRSNGNDMVMSDLRMGVECAYAFNFVVAEKTDSGLQVGSFQQFSQRPNMSEINNIFKRIWDPNVDLTPTQQRNEGC